MKKRIGAVIAIAAVLIGSYFYAHIDKNVYLYDRATDSSEYAGLGVLYGENEIRQTFVSGEDQIDGINVKATIVGDAADVVVTYEVIDNETGDVTGGSVKGTEIQNNKFNVLELEQIRETAGKEYTLVLRETGSSEGNGISFYKDPAEAQNGTLTIGGEVSEGTLVVRTITQRFDLETFVVLLGFVAFIAVFMTVLYRLFK